MALIFRATRGLQWIRQWVATPKGGANPQTYPQFRLRAETRPHEAGMPSNRMSQSCGEYVPAPCTHRPSSHPSENLVRHYWETGSLEPDFYEGG